MKNTDSNETIRKIPLMVFTVFLCCFLSAQSFAAQKLVYITILDDIPPLTSAEENASVLVPEAPGTKVLKNSLAVIDYSNASQGYVMIKYTGSISKIKVIIQKTNGTQYRYDLKLKNQYEVFPFTNGDGIYSVGVYENMSGTSYAEALCGSVKVKLEDQFLPFLYPNQLVNFNSSSKVVIKSNDLIKSSQKDLDKISSIFNYVVKNISYDTQKAQTVQSGYLPNVDSTLDSGKGICFDYASLMASMLRAQGIPTRLEIGLVSGGGKHAWISTFVTDIGWINTIEFDGENWSLMDPTFASSGNQSKDIMKFIGNGNNYTVQNYY